MPEETEMNSVFNAVFHPWIKPRSYCMYLFHNINCSVLWLISVPGRGHRILDRRQLTWEELCRASVLSREIGSCHLSLYHVRVTITTRKSKMESWEKNLSAHWKNTLSCQNQKEKKQDVQNYVMLSNSPTVDSKISKIRSDVQNSSAAEDTLQKYMSTFFHFKSICCITTEASSPF